jgi:hypothetical protein
MGRVRNVVLIECTLGLGKPKKGRDLGWEGTLASNEQGELVYKQPGTEVDDSCHKLGGFQVSRRGYKGEERGSWQGEIKARGMRHV